ncbi:MAG: energy-coupling factor ABC transporter ATP-binding protein [Treponema sp.]|jgi:energy-coupling factor transport system ATP-binding protein|nr:energy-coupling factor ABC transporter ATP-binding protein [Treponema sp.]
MVNELMNETIRIEHLRYSWAAGTCALDDINLRIADNEFTAIIGQNGSGKTTLLKNICGLLRPAQGDIFIRGHNTRDLSVAAISAEIGFVMQNPDRQLFAATVYDEAAFALKNRGLSKQEIKERAEAALAAVGLSDEKDTFPPALSRGDRAKAVIASVLAMGSKIIMLDEPCAGQDYRSISRIMDLIKELHGKGYTIIVVTHNMSLAAEYAQRIIVMKDGLLFMDGKPEDIFSRPQELTEARILPPPITRLSHELRNYLPLKKDALNAAELAAMLVAAKRK